jgi:hypothetical protein
MTSIQGYTNSITSFAGLVALWPDAGQAFRVMERLRDPANEGQTAYRQQ